MAYAELVQAQPRTMPVPTTPHSPDVRRILDKCATQCEKCEIGCEKQVYLNFASNTYETQCPNCGHYEKDVKIPTEKEGKKLRRITEELSCDCHQNLSSFPKKVKEVLYLCTQCASSRKKVVYFDDLSRTFETECQDCGDRQEGI